MKYIFDFGLSISNIFKVLKINGFVNFLLLNKYGNIFQYEMKGLKFYLFKIKWKVNVLRFYLLKINWKVNIWICFKWLSVKNFISCKDIIFGKFEHLVQLGKFSKWLNFELNGV